MISRSHLHTNEGGAFTVDAKKKNKHAHTLSEKLLHDAFTPVLAEGKCSAGIAYISSFDGNLCVHVAYKINHRRSHKITGN